MIWFQAVDVLLSLPPQVLHVTFRTSVIDAEKRPSNQGLVLSIMTVLDWSRLNQALAHCASLRTWEIVLSLGKHQAARRTLEQNEEEMRDTILGKLSPRLQAIVQVAVE